MDESLLKGLYDGCSQTERVLTLQYFEHLQNTDDAWKLCMTHFTDSVNCDDRVQFFCLQVLEHHVKLRHAMSSETDAVHLRKIALSWFEPTTEFNRFKSFIKNKMAQIVSLIFIIDYPLKWTQFFYDLLSLLDGYNSVYTIDMYLRTLIAVDHNIADKEIYRTQEEHVKNTFIKDHMRDTCVPDLVESWLHILALYEFVDSNILCQTMTVVGCYVSWIDITLIANDKFISLLLQYLSVPSLRESAATCLHEIISKGMEPLPKLELVNALVKLLEDAGILGSHEVDDEESDFQSKMSYLVNGIGVSLVTSYHKLIKMEDKVNAARVLQSIHGKVPYMISYLTDDDDGVSENVVSFATQYIGVLKHLGDLSDDLRQTLQVILQAVITKLKYDDSYNFVNPGEIEALFIEYRNKLRVLFDNISQVDPSLVITVAQSLLTQSLTNLDQQSYADVEVSLLIFHFVSEHTFEKLFGSASTAGSPFHTMMTQILECNLSCFPHSAVILQYYEAILRQEKFFSTSPQYIPQVMKELLDHRGLRHGNPAVRSRLCYQFLRFVKSTKLQISEIAEQTFENIRPILCQVLDLCSNEVLITANDALFLYEAAGYLVVYSAQFPEGKYELMKSLLSPILEKFNFYLAQLCAAPTVQEQDAISQLLYFLLSYASRTSKVFPNHQTTSQSGCLPCFVEALPVVLQGLQVTLYRDRLQSGVRQYLHRMIICLGDELLKAIPLAVSLLLKDAESHDIQEFIPLINQLITKYKSRIAPFLQEVFVPVVETIISCSNKPFDPQDLEEHRERQNLQKSYYLFLNSLCINGVTEVLACQGTEHLHNVLQTIVEGANSSPDPSVKKICFMSLKKLIEAWGCEDTTIDGFIDYTYKEILPSCFLVPLQSNFDLNEAQSFLCLGEIVGLLKELIKQRGTEFLSYLQNQYLPSLQISADITQEVVVRLQENDTKSLKPYFKALFLNLRTHLVQ